MNDVENVVEKTKEELNAEKEERKRLREEKRKQKELEEQQNNMHDTYEITDEMGENITAEEITEDTTYNVVEEPVKKVKHTPHVTKHNFATGEEVYVAEFTQVRDSDGFTMVINNYRFVPTKGVIDKVIITDKVQYKLKGKAGSLYDEEDVCYDIEEAEKLCRNKNTRR